MTTETIKTFTSKVEARRLNRRLRDHGILSRMNYARGQNTVTIIVPEKYAAGIDGLCERIANETAVSA